MTSTSPFGSPFDLAASRVAGGADPSAEADGLVALMTPAEILGCLDGDTPFWPGLFDMVGGGYYEHPWPAAVVERLGIPGIAFADGPRGCVVGHSTAFPVAMARGASWDVALEEEIGEAIGAELRAHGATFTGAVCVNLLRHPGWGRAQETYGEDPHHVGEMGAALTRGLQRWVLACVKHFACNSMENARFTVDVSADDRALHEVYLPHFRRIVEEGVASVMSAYNSLNGTFCGDNAELLTDVLRTEWGFDGFVISDFIFGLRDARRSVEAGLNIEMPFRQQRHRDLTEADADTPAARSRAREIVATLLRFSPLLARTAPPMGVVASDHHRALARRAAVRSITLLQNTGGLLPVAPQALRRVAVLGRLAVVANLGDGGSSDVHPPSTVTPLDGLRAALPGVEIVHAVDDASIAVDADLVVVVVGTTKADEGEFVSPTATGRLNELMFPAMTDADRAALAASPPRQREDRSMAPGGDRRTIELPVGDIELIGRAAAANERTVVCVMGGSAFVMESWRHGVGAVLMLWYPGMEGGRALADVLTGSADPGGRLPFAVPTDEAHLPHFDPDATEVTYDLWHGQWKLDRDGVAAAFPFGFGLSYADIAITDASGDLDEVRCTVANRGSRSGSTVVQVYASMAASAHERPRRKLVGFARVDDLAPGSRRPVTVATSRLPLEVRVDGRWVTEPGSIRVEVGQFAGDPDAVGFHLPG